MKILFFAKISFLLLLFVWSVKMLLCIFTQNTYRDVDLFSVFFGVFLYFMFYISIFIILFYFGVAVKYCRLHAGKMYVFFLVFPLLGWFLSVHFIIDGLNGRTLDKLHDKDLLYAYWKHCLFTLSPRCI